MQRKDGEKVLQHSVRLRCDVHRAFRMFTDNYLVASWLILPFGGDHAEIEPRVRGKYELFWNRQSREIDSTLGCRITAIEPDKFLAFEWRGPAQFKEFMNDADPLTHVVVFFLPADASGRETEVHLIHSGWGSSPRWTEAMDYFRKAWGGAFQKLAEQVNGGS